MGDLVLARRYAQVLVSLGLEEGDLDRLARDMNAVCMIFEKSSELKSLISARTIPTTVKLKVFDAISKKIKLSDLCANTVKLLIEKARTHILGSIGREFAKEIGKRNGMMDVHVRVASDDIKGELDEDITHVIKNKFGKKANITYETDEELVAGLQIKIGDHLYDMSIKGDIKRMREKIIRGIYGDQG